MKKYKPNLPLSIGLIIYSVTVIVTNLKDIPRSAHYMLMLAALAFELWGLILTIRSPEMRNSKLRRWKLRLIGKELK